MHKRRALRPGSRSSRELKGTDAPCTRAVGNIMHSERSIRLLFTDTLHRPQLLNKSRPVARDGEGCASYAVWYSSFIDEVAESPHRLPGDHYLYRYVACGPPDVGG
jgi:hypothetical protein